MMMRRRKSRRVSPPPLRRCSTASIKSLNSNTCSIDHILTTDQLTLEDNNHGINVNVHYSLLHRIRRFFRFDALDLESTCMRNAKMMSTLDEGSVSYIYHYGVDVCFTDEYHLPASTLERYRKIGDPEMDQLLTKLTNIGPFDDVISAAATAAASNDPTISETSQELAQFYKHYEQVPSWVDFDQIQRGINVFLAYLPAAACALYYRSLVGGFSIPKIIEVLKSTRYLISDRKKTLERLIDTGGLLAACFAPTNGHIPAESLRPGGKGWIAALQVRVLHAKVRRRLLQRKRSTSSQVWDTEKNGIPINQEDLAATLLAFSVNVLVGIEIIAGTPLPVNEQLDYLALWRYIGWLLGIDTPESEDVSSNGSDDSREDSFPLDPCAPSMLHSYASLESILVHILHPEPSSCDLVTHLLSVRGSMIAFRAEVCRRLIGNPLADALGLQDCSCWNGWGADAIHTFVTSLFVKTAVFTYLMLFRFYTLLTMHSPWLKEKATIFHGELEKKFLHKWEEGHSKRMRAASKMDMTASAGASEMSSSCPFSMVMPPQE